MYSYMLTDFDTNVVSARILFAQSTNNNQQKYAKYVTQQFTLEDKNAHANSNKNIKGWLYELHSTVECI